MSPPCAAQIASEAADWLQPEVIASILEQLHALDNGDAGTASAESAIAAAEPVAMLLSTWAAALSYLNAYAAVMPENTSIRSAFADLGNAEHPFLDSLLGIAGSFPSALVAPGSSAAASRCSVAEVHAAVLRPAACEALSALLRCSACLVSNAGDDHVLHQQHFLVPAAISACASHLQALPSSALRQLTADDTALGQQQLHPYSLLTQALELLEWHAQPSEVPTSEEQISAVQHVDVVIRLLNLLPPGAEALAVRALSAVLKPSCMRAILCTAQHSMQQLSQHTGAQAWAKAASSATPLTGDALQLDYSFPELSHQEPQEAADMLLQGYAAAWLGLIPAPATTKSAHAGSAAEAAGGAYGLPGSFVTESAGSRLPLPACWPVTDIFLPDPAASGSHRQQGLSSIAEEGTGSSQEAAEARASRQEQGSRAVGYALMLWLALDSWQQPCATAPASGTKLRSMLDLVLCPSASPTSPLYTHSHSRWPLAAILQLLIPLAQPAPSQPGQQPHLTELPPLSPSTTTPSNQTPHAVTNESAAECAAQEPSAAASAAVSEAQPADKSQSAADMQSSAASAAVSAESAGMIPNRQLVATEDQATSSTASADWAASIGEQDVRRWAEAFAAESFGDPLIAAALSLLLLPAVPYQLQEALLRELMEAAALHLLPDMLNAPWPAHRPTLQPLDERLLPLLASLLADGHLSKSFHRLHNSGGVACSEAAAWRQLPMPAYLALNHLSAALLSAGEGHQQATATSSLAIRSRQRATCFTLARQCALSNLAWLLAFCGDIQLAQAGAQPSIALLGSTLSEALTTGRMAAWWDGDSQHARLQDDHDGLMQTQRKARVLLQSCGQHDEQMVDAVCHTTYSVIQVQYDELP